MIAIKTLTAAQYGVLNKIARRTKMDCWFCIQQDADGQDYVFDLELNTTLPLDEGIQGLMEGLDCPENIESCDLNWIEKTVLCDLCKMLDVSISNILEVK